MNHVLSVAPGVLGSHTSLATSPQELTTLARACLKGAAASPHPVSFQCVLPALSLPVIGVRPP